MEFSNHIILKIFSRIPRSEIPPNIPFLIPKIITITILLDDAFTSNNIRILF